MVSSFRVSVQAYMKYLDLILDGRWRLDKLFIRLAWKLFGAASALVQLLPNLGQSLALYGAPVRTGFMTDGLDVSLPAVVQVTVKSERAWAAVASLCEDDVSRKETVERVREDNAIAEAAGERTGKFITFEKSQR